ncbi:BON domain-containing protein [Neisseria chenwenguii]|uniref:Hemolysin n=1 Tax=Neisseria chenwenguii TaxID=1853278 RepID=A0A220S1Z4_9NEIS|nr:BON domain-containing protein [Neisseria chenwenguii]ASK27520.1 hemolysin [Neisseria chenwenguii]ROV55599.1 BON domain-containing protein [Neisseria chenwenguii]
MKQTAKLILTAATASVMLAGCLPAIVGGAAVGTKSVVDRRSSGAQADDNVMAVRVAQSARSYLRQNNPTIGYKPKISVVSYNRNLLLLGQVSNESEKQAVEQIARNERAAANVYNYITVSPDARTFDNVATDSWGTSKVRTALLGLPASTQARVKIVTYGNVTYVMGILTPTEQAAVTQRVSTTIGVQKVVTLYQEYNGINGSASAPAAPVSPAAAQP